jgi:hypothetical protein
MDCAINNAVILFSDFNAMDDKADSTFSVLEVSKLD